MHKTQTGSHQGYSARIFQSGCYLSCTSTQEHARSCTMPAIISLQDVVMQDLLKDSALVIEILH